MATDKPHRLRFDVFISFRGEDTRHGITKRVYDALNKRNNVRAFLDNDGMQRGDEVAPTLVAAMEDSAASVVVLSPRYADSHWCLDELAMLCDLRESLKRPIIPIFYEVNPSDIRKQSGRFVKDFENLAIDYSKKIQRWRKSMTLVGNLPGIVCRKETVDDDMIEQIVKRILGELSNTPEKVGDYTVGLDSRVDYLTNLFDIESSSDVQVLGLHGMGGIGKTTLAKAFYDNVVGNFNHTVFISNVSERSSDQDGLVNLQNIFIKELFRSEPKIEDVNSGRENIKESVHEKKILIVLDDVDKVDQFNALVGERSWYGEGTLIVITSRDEQIVRSLSVNQQYEVKCLTEEQALKLFSYHSLRKEKPSDSLLEISKEIVQILRLLPLAVEVFGSLLYDKNNEKDWHTLLEKLKNTQPNDLHGILALSFEYLEEEEEKNVFLDIACLFIKMEIKKEEVVDALKGCGFNAEAAISILTQKSLLKNKEDDTLWMHDLIRDMGRHMVLNKSREDPGMQTRLWDHGEIMSVLNDMKGTSSIRGIVFDFKKKFARDPTADEIASRNLRNTRGIKSIFTYLLNKIFGFPAEEKPKSSEITIPVEPFVPMTKLNLLQINNVELEGNLKLLPSELKWLQWKGCPLEILPPEFLARQLVVLDLSESGIRQVQSCRKKKVDENLKVVNLRGCHSLEAIPDLLNHIALEKLVLERCNLLEKVPSSVGNLKKLLHLDLRNCSKLVEFRVSVSGLKLLEKLFLSGCSNLSVLPENIGDMKCLKELLLDETAIKNLPESIVLLQKLEKLSLRGCKYILKLPSGIGAMISLEKLYLNDTALKELPDSIGKLKNLQELHLVRCKSLSKIPDTINDLKSLKELFIDRSVVEKLPLKSGSLPCLTDFSAGDCKSLKQVPSSIGGLNSLCQLQLNNTPIETLPTEIGDLRFICKLELTDCKSLKALPESIGKLDTLNSLNLSGSNIEELPTNFGKLENLVTLRMNKCEKLKRLPESFGELKSLHHLYMQESSVIEMPASLKGLSKLKELLLYDCRELKSLPPLPCKLEKLNLANCFSLESVSDLSELEILHEINLTNCEKVNDIPGLEHLKALKRLYMSGCNSICSLAVKKRLSKASLKMMRNLSLPGNRIPDWFSQGPLTFSAQPNKELRGVILAVVVALNHKTEVDHQSADVVEVQAQILKLDLPLYTHTLHLSGVPRTSNDQLHICRYSVFHPMTTILKDGYTIQVIKRTPPIRQDVELKMHGIHMVYDGDDDTIGDEEFSNEKLSSVSQKLAKFFRSFDDDDDETNPADDSTVT